MYRVPRGICSKMFGCVLHVIYDTKLILYDKNTRQIILLPLPRGTGN